MVAMWFTDGLRERPGGVVARCAQTASRATDPEGYARTCEALETADATTSWAAITAPTLVVCGDHRRAAVRRRGRAGSPGELPDAGLVWLDGTHAVALERPTEFADVVAEFLA